MQNHDYEAKVTRTGTLSRILQRRTPRIGWKLHVTEAEVNTGDLSSSAACPGGTREASESGGNTMWGGVDFLQFSSFKMGGGNNNNS